MARGKYRSHIITSAFRKESLDEIFAHAALSPGDPAKNAAFAEYQADWLCRAIPGFKLDYMSASYVQTDNEGAAIDVQCALWNLPEEIIENYWSVEEFDTMAPIVYNNPGYIIAHDDVLSEKEWRGHPFFLRHLKHFGIYGALMINARLPGRELTHITLEYLANEDNKTFKALDRMLLESLTLPFALAWLFRFGAIDRPVLKRNFALMADLTSTELTFLRKYVTCPHLDLASQAEDLGVTPAAYKQSLYLLRDELHPRTTLPHAASSRPTLRQMDSAYIFLRLLGDPTASPSLTA